MRGSHPEVYYHGVSKPISKRHNKTLLLYHLVCPVKYRRKALTETVGCALKEVCLGIQQRYEIRFIEIGADEDHVHFLLQSVPGLSPSTIAKIIKSLTSKHIFENRPEVKKILWGGNFRTSGFYMNTVGQHANEEIIKQYVQNQDRRYKRIHRQQLSLFDL